MKTELELSEYIDETPMKLLQRGSGQGVGHAHCVFSRSHSLRCVDLPRRSPQSPNKACLLGNDPS